MSKLLKKILKFVAYTIAWFFFLTIVLLLLLVVISLFRDLFRGVSVFANPNSMFNELIKIEFSYLIYSAVLSFFISFFFIIFVAIISEKFGKKHPVEVQRKRAAFLWNGTTALFLTLTLIFAFDEKGFTIATSIVSFFALLWPLTKEFWMEQFPLNQFEKDKQVKKNTDEQE